jgi:hypothetical protein
VCVCVCVCMCVCVCVCVCVGLERQLCVGLVKKLPQKGVTQVRDARRMRQANPMMPKHPPLDILA